MITALHLTDLHRSTKFRLMNNSPGRRWNGSSVSVHGPALRHIRQLTGLTTSHLADEAGITTDYLRKVELGVNRAVAPHVYARLIFALRIDDRRVLLADPWPLPIDADDDPVFPEGPEVEPAEPVAVPLPEKDGPTGPARDSVQDQIAAHAREIAARDQIERAS